MAQNVDCFLNPASVAVIGASETFGSWGHMIMDCLLTSKYQGSIYPVNPKGGEIMGIPAFTSLAEAPAEVELAVIAVPAEHVFGLLDACAAKKVKGILMITAEFSEAVEGGKEAEQEMARFARDTGIRIIGPNVSGIFDQTSGFYACPSLHLPIRPSPISFICQGGFAIYDLMRKGFTEHKGVGKMIHTGNEADLKLPDFLEHIGDDDDTRVVLLHIEGIRDGRRFCEVGRRVARRKPVIAFKAGTTDEGARAAASHTGALAGSGRIYSGLFSQLGMIEAPQFEIMLDMGYAFLTQPPMQGNRVCIITMGGSWGVVVTDSLAAHGLTVPEPSDKLQKTLRDLGFPVRASTRNPIDFGAAGASLRPDARSALLHELVNSGEFDALLIHGLCMAGHLTEDSPPERRFFVAYHKSFIQEAVDLGREKGVVVLPMSHITSQESQIYQELNQAGIAVYNRADDAAGILAGMRRYAARREWA